VKPFQWIVSAALSAYACRLAVLHATPIDRALPFVAVVLTLLAALSYPSLMVGIPLLIVAELAIDDESLRLLAFGAIVAVSFATAMAAPEREERDGWRSVAIAIAAIVLLRWIPLGGVQVGRELFLVVVAAAIVFVLGRTPFSVLAAVLAVLVTPAVPLRTLLLPVLVVVVATLARTFGMPRLRLAWISSAIVGFSLLFFAWSGVVARAFPWFLRRAEPPVARSVVSHSLVAGQRDVLIVPPTARSLIVSGANVAKLERGTLLGTIDPGARPVRIGDAADWGYTRREHFYGSRNPLPADSAGRIRDYGYAAWIDGAGRIALPQGARTIVVTASPSLPDGASLQVEGFE
jgi:hypothetical protein